MSTTRPSGSSAGRRNSTSTTYVAPCSRCAGPNVSPLKLWATMKWSRTQTEYIAATRRRYDGRGCCPAPSASRARTFGRSSNRSSPVTSASGAGSARRRNARSSRRARDQRARCAVATFPTCDDFSVSRLAWKPAPSASGTARAPNQLSSRTVASKPASSSASAAPSGAPLAWITRSASGRAAPGAAKPTPSARATAARAGFVSISSTSQPGMRPASQATRQPSAPAPTTAIRSPSRGSASHRPLIAVSRFAASTARSAGTSSGKRAHGLRRHDVARLVRVEAEHPAAAERRRAVLHLADADVAVLHRCREVAALKRCAHPLVFAGRHFAAEDERLGAPAEGAVECAHPDLARLASDERLAPYLPLAGPGDPERTSIVRGHGSKGY